MRREKGPIPASTIILVGTAIAVGIVFFVSRFAVPALPPVEAPKVVLVSTGEDDYTFSPALTELESAHIAPGIVKLEEAFVCGESTIVYGPELITVGGTIRLNDEVAVQVVSIEWGNPCRIRLRWFSR